MVDGSESSGDGAGMQMAYLALRWPGRRLGLRLRRLALVLIGDGIPNVETVGAGVGTDTDGTDVETAEGY